ncbi:DinB family protein [Paenibacillus sp. GYB003]|uniref:DinB family protein n=1 Tax=Paenibacillus sp. GYB003 TaxID=2994392 RepID=UPI002F96301C
MSLRKPGPAEYAGHFGEYIGQVPDGSLTDILNEQADRVRRLFGSVREEDGGYRYAPDKWSVKEVLGHIVDTETVMSYRMMRVARGDRTPLPGFDENDFVRGGEFGRLTIAALLEQFDAVRRATVLLVGSLPEKAWAREGTVSGHAITARALAYVIAGHERHHTRLLEERYGAVVAKA